jgi:predicted dehydrogenase
VNRGQYLMLIWCLVYVEWPLGFTSEEAKELTELAKSKGVKTIAGIQTYADPVVHKAQEIIASGAIGDIVSSSVQGVSIYGNGDIHQAMLTYFKYDKSLGTGGSMYTIMTGHCKCLIQCGQNDTRDANSKFRTFSRGCVYQSPGPV